MITLLREGRANLSAFHTFVRFVLVWFRLFPLPLGVWEGLQLVIVTLPGFSLTFFVDKKEIKIIPMRNPRWLLWPLCFALHLLNQKAS